MKKAEKTTHTYLPFMKTVTITIKRKMKTFLSGLTRLRALNEKRSYHDEKKSYNGFVAYSHRPNRKIFLFQHLLSS